MKQTFFFLVSVCAVVLMSCTAKQKDYSNYAHAVRIDSIVSAAVDSSMIPGAVVCVVEGNSMAYMKAFGYRQVWPDTLPMTENTQFDLASLSKVVGTGMSVMRLIDEGKVDLEAPMSTYLPEYQPYTDADGNVGREQKVVDFLTHTSGLPAYASYKWLLKDNVYASRSERKEALRQYMATCRRRTPAGTDCEYSCLNFISLQYMLEAVTGMPLNEYAEKYVFKPLGMKHTCYYPIGENRKSREIVAPTEKIAAWDAYDEVPSILYADAIEAAYRMEFEAGSAQEESEIRNEYIESTLPQYAPCYEAIVHDPLAREINAGVSGNAGVFSTAGDLAKLAIWVMNTAGNKSVTEGRKAIIAERKSDTAGKGHSQAGPFSAETLDLMVMVPAGYEEFGRALAWDSNSDYSWVKGDNCSERVVCHTGYTGTSIVIDLEQQKALIVLTNRAHPNDGGGVSKMRRELANIVFGD